jgi:hypothetical protein
MLAHLNEVEGGLDMQRSSADDFDLAAALDG